VACEGFVSPGFEPVRDAFLENFAAGEVGAAFAAMVDGELVVDLWGGLRDSARGVPWERDTIATIFSGSKGLVATCILRLIEEGALGLDDRVCEHWPEFEANGKRHVLVRHVVSHTAGLPGVRARVSREDAADPERVAAMLASQELFWPPGERLCYHPLSYGWLCGELVRRVSGHSLGRYLHEEIVAPLGLEAWIGLPERLLGRVAESELDSAWAGPMGNEPAGWINPGDMHDIWLNPDLFEPGLPCNTSKWRTAEIPGAGAIATARAIATHYGILAAGGEAGGHRILNAETIAAGQQVLAEGIDPFDGEETRFGIGWALQTREARYGPPARAFGHGGAGGSIHGAWPDQRTGFSYVMNLLRDDPGDERAARLLGALHRCLGSEENPASRGSTDA
jgi:CubicO group peptidase (beta-lactamase class C family)